MGLRSNTAHRSLFLIERTMNPNIGVQNVPLSKKISNFCRTIIWDRYRSVRAGFQRPIAYMSMIMTVKLKRIFLIAKAAVTLKLSFDWLIDCNSILFFSVEKIHSYKNFTNTRRNSTASSEEARLGALFVSQDLLRCIIYMIYIIWFWRELKA